MALLLVALGGAAGSVARVVLVTAVHRVAPAGFPFGTFVVNVAGCFVFGVLAAAVIERGALTPGTRALLLGGLLGGFTTFSAFGFETFELIRMGRLASAALNAGGQVALGVSALWAGLLLGRLL